MRYIALGRVSTDAQGNNLSRDVQFEAIHAYASNQLWKCAGQFFDTASGSEKGLEERDGLREALRMLEVRDAELLILYDTSRIGREAKVVQDLIDRVYTLGGLLAVAVERRVYSSALEAQELLFWQGAVSQFEWIQIKKRTQRGKAKAIELGGFVWKPLTGYKLVKRDRIKQLEVDTEVAGLIVEVFARLLDGDLKSNVAAYAQKRGQSWDTRKITQLVKDVDIYAGGSRRYEVTLEGVRRHRVVSFPAIIERSTAERIKALGSSVQRKEGIVTPFLNVLYCGCGKGAGIVRRYKGNVQLVCNTHFAAQYHKRKGRQATSHSHSVAASFVRTAVLELLKDGSADFQFHVDKLVVFQTRYKRLIAESRSRMGELAREKEKVTTQVLRFDGKQNLIDVLDSELGRLNADEGRIQEELVERVETLAAIEAQLDLWESPDWNEIALEAYRALEQKDYGVANRLLTSIGVRVVADFSRPNVRDSLLAGVV